jgi:hypothetical protein
MPKITDNLSMECFGYFAQEHRGGIYHLVMGVGRTHIAVFAVGGIKVLGKVCLHYW